MPRKSNLLCFGCCGDLGSKHSSRIFQTSFPWRRGKNESLFAESDKKLNNPEKLSIFEEKVNAIDEYISLTDVEITCPQKETDGPRNPPLTQEIGQLPAESMCSNLPEVPRSPKSPNVRGINVSSLIERFEKESRTEHLTPQIAPRSAGKSAEVKISKPTNVHVSDHSDFKTGELNPIDTEDVVVRLRNEESKFDRRKKYQSMFKDAPLYQVYDDRIASPKAKSKSPVAQVKKGQRNTNSLEFADKDFLPIDSDDQNHKMSDQGVDEPKNQGADSPVDSDSQAASGGSRTPRQKSPPPAMFDHRLRKLSPSFLTPDEKTRIPPKKLVKRTPSDPREMQACVDEFAGTGPNRSMWSSMPQVVSLGLANGLAKIQRKLQEALFEIITSEASYYRSLTVLIEVFYKSPCLQPGFPGAVISHTQKHHLFSNILDIHLTSENILRAMEACFRQDPWLIRLCEIVYDHVEQNFDTYITYMQNQMFQHRTLEHLQSNVPFNTVVRNLQSQPECAFLNLPSFLILPTQRIPRMCLLMSAVLNYAPKGSLIYRSGLVALAALDKCVREGEAKKLHLEQKERLMILAKQFEYKFDAKSLATASRRLIKEGQLGLLSVQHVDGSAFRQRLSGIMRQKSVRASLFLFNDLLVIAKKRKNNRLSVDEYCALTDVKVEIMDTPPGAIILRHYPQASEGLENGDNSTSTRKTALARKASAPAGSQEVGFYSPYTFRIIIQSETHPRAEYILQAKSLSERERWVDAISPIQYAATDDRLVRDCPQLLAVRSYLAREGDELELREGDSVGLLISLSDGWCKGMLPGGKKGWFPDNVCVEVEDDSVKIESVKKFLLMEEARNAYKRRKAREQFVDFQRVGGNVNAA